MWLLRKALDTWKYEGLMAVLAKAKRYLIEGRPIVPPMQHSVPHAGLPVYECYKFILGRMQCGKIIEDAPQLHTINWIVPDLGAPGAGGHLTIFRCVKFLENHGYHNRVYFFNIMGGDTRGSVKNIYKRHYKNVAGDKAEIFSAHFDEIQPAEALIATSWQTAYLVRSLKNCKKKYYFVQDFEPMFFASSSEYYFAEETYRWGLIGITASPWLKLKLEQNYGMKCYAFGFSFNKDVYYPRAVKKSAPQIFLYARPNTPRRMFETAVLALTLVSERLPNTKFALAGGRIKGNYKLPFAFKDSGIASHEELAVLYAESDICVVLSGSNVSLVPLEVMGCKSVVLTNDDEHVRWLLNEDNAILARMEPQDIANKICDYLEHPEKLEQLRESGYEFARNTSWDEEYGKVLAAIKNEVDSSDERNT